MTTLTHSSPHVVRKCIRADAPGAKQTHHWTYNAIPWDEFGGSTLPSIPAINRAPIMNQKRHGYGKHCYGRWSENRHGNLRAPVVHS
jgi:hypothetical protein